MPPATDDNNPFSAAELRLIVICFRNMKSIPEIDFEAVAIEYGYKSAVVAKQKFCVAKGKCKAKLNNSPRSKPAKNVGFDSLSNKRRVNSEPGEPATPSKRRTNKSTAKNDLEDQDSDDDSKAKSDEDDNKEDAKVKEEDEDDDKTVQGDHT